MYVFGVLSFRSDPNGFTRHSFHSYNTHTHTRRNRRHLPGRLHARQPRDAHALLLRREPRALPLPLPDRVHPAEQPAAAGTARLPHVPGPAVFRGAGLSWGVG